MRFKDYVFRTRPKKGASRKLRRTIAALDRYWNEQYGAKILDAVQEMAVNEMINGTSAIHLSWGGDDVAFEVT